MPAKEPEPPSPLSERLRARYGERIDPHVSLDPAPKSDVGPDSRLFEKLSSDGPRGTRYRLLGEIARGGMGAIIKVWDDELRRTLAMKVILGNGDESSPAGQATDVEPRTLGRFLEEAQITGQLDHPGIVPVHELGLDAEGRVYFTMRLVKGEDLRAAFEHVKTGREGWNQVRGLNVLLRVCEAVAFAHTKDVIHRDLKPANVMVGRFGEVVVMDWGLARVMGREDTHDLRLQSAEASAPSRVRTDRRDVDSATPDSPLLTMDGDVVGTPSYMPPEQARGDLERLGPHSDVYSIGAMLYELLTGTTPYVPAGARVSPYTILMAVIHGPPASVESLAPRTPPELVAICEKAMAREIDERYPDVTALAVDLRAYLEGRVVAAYETGSWAEAKKWVRRNKALALTAAAALVMLLVVAGWALAERRTALANELAAVENEQEAERERDRANAERRMAEAERDRMLRLSDKRRIDVLRAEADALWPAHPDKVAALTDWIDDAERLLANLPLHEATLREVRDKGAPVAHPREVALAGARSELEKLEGGVAVPPGIDRAEVIAAVKEFIADLETRIPWEQSYEFGDDANARWWHDAVRDLVVGLHGLQANRIAGQTLAAMRARLAWAQRVEVETTTGTEVAAKWADARAAIRAHPDYGGLDLAPQLGLVPLGPDPDSKLWEFGHPQTGDVPSRDPKTGKLAVDGGTGLVFVLIPGGTYRIGAQSNDPSAPHYDPRAAIPEAPVIDVQLAPFLLSKYEMTQGQWRRFTGTNPSWWYESYRELTSPAHPIEHVSWQECTATLARLAMVLPTEAQWEAACRARTETFWSFGDDDAELPTYANIRDLSYLEFFSGIEASSCDQLDDDHSIPARVGSFAPNRFGLHDLHGNVAEWCLDGFALYDSTKPREADALIGPIEDANHVMRGSHFGSRGYFARSSSRNANTSDYTSYDVGVRPVRAIE